MKKCKIGLTTLHVKNYGSILQCFATKEYLTKQGYVCTILDVEEKKIEASISAVKKAIRLFHDAVSYRGYFKEWLMMKKSMHQDLGNLSATTLKQMDRFVEENLCPKTFIWSDLKKLAKSEEYIAFITGSDQVWNLSRKLNPLFFLEFCDKEKRIALSVSCGTSSVPDFNKKDFKKKLSGFDTVSVREETAVDIISQLVDIPVLRLADPTILLTSEEWKNLFNKDKTEHNTYVLVHFLNSPSKLAIDFINAKLPANVKVICLGYHYDEMHDIINAEFVDGGPDEYIRLISGAKYIFTDSFHTTLFSINFSKDFFVFERQYTHGFPQTSRLTDLLKRTGVYHRFIYEFKQPIKEIDYEFAQQVLLHERSMIQEFLQKQIEQRK